LIVRRLAILLSNSGTVVVSHAVTIPSPAMKVGFTIIDPVED
jgi:hypothetical protein